MKTIRNERTIFCDIDGTLIVEPNDSMGVTLIVDPLDPHNQIAVTRHEPMIRLLKEEHHRGAYVVVWSRGGYEWAETVVKALGLENYVHQIMSKPLVYFDDVEIKDWLPYRVFLPPEMKYKENY